MKGFYRLNTVELYNGHKIAGTEGSIHYGEIPDIYQENSYTSYDALVKALDADEVDSEYFYVHTIPVINQKVLAHNSWTDVIRHPEKEFVSYIYKHFVEKMPTEPSLKILVERLPVNELIDWCKDNSISFGSFLSK